MTPFHNVNQIRLEAAKAVPTPSLSPWVHRGSMPGCPKALPLLVGFVLKLVGLPETMCLEGSATFERAVCAAFAFMISDSLAMIFPRLLSRPGLRTQEDCDTGRGILVASRHRVMSGMLVTSQTSLVFWFPSIAPIYFTA